MPSVTAGTCNRFVGFVTILQTNTVVHGIKPQHATNCAVSADETSPASDRADPGNALSHQPTDAFEMTNQRC